MAQKPLTPAQSYMDRMITALTGVIDNPDDTDWIAEVMIFVLERPQTLRSALRAALYKSVNQYN